MSKINDGQFRKMPSQILDWVGRDWVGIKMGWVSPSMVRYRASYSAKNASWLFKIDKQAFK